jgi:kynurenine formamidase
MKINIQGTRIIDLSQTLEPDIPKPVKFPDPSLEFFRRIDSGDVVNVEKITFCPHSGTHIDAPFHFIEGGKTVEEIPPEVVIGPAVVVDLRHMIGSAPIEREDIQKWENVTGEKICAGDAVLLMTNFSKLWKTGKEGDAFLTSGWPYITRSVAQYFLELKIRLVGVESMDLDLIDPFDLSTSEFIGHRTFLPNGIYIIENLTNLDKIGSTRCQIIATPLKIKGGTGSPLRVIAVV